MKTVKLEETDNRRRLHIGSCFVDLNESDFQELVKIFSRPTHSEETDTTEKHTPTPWVYHETSPALGEVYVKGSDGKRVADCGVLSSEKHKANAQLIVTAVNSYPRLQAENERLMDAIKKSGDWGLVQENASLQIRIDERNKALKQLLDALPRPDVWNSKLIAAMENAHELITTIH